MRICELKISNFRGISHAHLLFPDHAVLIGDNNTGKSTILEALDLVLGPDRAFRQPPIDEHDFFGGEYLVATQPTEGEEGASNGDADDDENTDADSVIEIHVDVTVCDLTDDQQARFMANVEWWGEEQKRVLEKPSPEEMASAKPCIRVSFVGQYSPEDDDFTGETFFTKTEEDGLKQPFRKRDKQTCGFLYLRTLRTGSRALSLEHGSLLDIILRLKEVRPKMWEQTLSSLEQLHLDDRDGEGLGGVLESLNSALGKYVPKEWGAQPQLRVSNLTREHLRHVVTAFLATGEGEHLAPYYRQGTGTINMLVLALLSQIAEEKHNVIFAMEEPEIAIPPYAQKQIINEVRRLSSQTIFTSHSPYVLEEFGISETIPLSRDQDGKLKQSSIELPPNIKPKFYRQHFRTVFCEALLSRRVLIAEGATETIALPAVARRLSELNSNEFQPLEMLGICTIDAGSETKIAGMAEMYRKLGKKTYAICDKQDPKQEAGIAASVDVLMMHQETSFEKMLVNGTTDAALERYLDSLSWPQALQAKFPNPKDDLRKSSLAFLSKYKGEGVSADFLVQCEEGEIPEWIKDACRQLARECRPPSIEEQAAEKTDAGSVDGAEAEV